MGPHLAMQDPVTGEIMHSACNSKSTPILPADGKNVFGLRRRARRGTALAGAGWYDAKRMTTMVRVPQAASTRCRC